MEIGKVPENVLKRSVFKKLTVKRPEVLVHAGVGEDCAVLAPTENALVLSTDPITASAKEIGTIAFHITANDIASSGAELVGILLTIIMPPNSEAVSYTHLSRKDLTWQRECVVLKMER